MSYSITNKLLLLKKSILGPMTQFSQSSSGTGCVTCFLQLASDILVRLAVQDIQRQCLFLQPKYSKVVAIKYCQPILTKHNHFIKIK